MPKYIYKISHYIKESNFKCESTMHVVACNVEEVMEILDDNEFNSDGIISISRQTEVREDYSFD